jgi:hypothetical protein
VDIFVEKPLLTAVEPRFHAGFNKMPKQNAKLYPFKINGLANTPEMKNRLSQNFVVAAHKVLACE